jgi:membrane protein implicated in regulation of membrane protease activity
MTVFYIALLILGLTAFAVSAFGVDHDLDFGDHDFDSVHADSPGVFSIRTISSLFAGFGVAGILAKLVFNWGIGGQLLLGFGVGLLFAVLVWLIMYAFYTQQAGSLKDATDLVGKTAVVTTATGDQGIGECRVDNSYFTFREKTKTPVVKDEIVRVIESEAGLLIVEKL